MQGGPYNILTFDTHERYQTQLCKTGHNFYSFRYEDCKEWDEDYAAIPENYCIMPPNNLIKGVEIDLILSQSKWGQIQAAHRISNALGGTPIVSLEHTLPLDHWDHHTLEQFKSMNGDINVFISEFSRDKWGIFKAPMVVHHSVDTELFCPDPDVTKKKHALSVVNDWINRDYCCNYTGWTRITEGLPTRVVGKTEGLSEPAPNIEALVKEYQSAAVFLNTSTVSPVPSCLLEAMACGCAVVTTETCMIPEIIEHGQNGFMSNDEEELRQYTEKLLEEPQLAEKMGACARQTIIEKFGEEQFIANWNNIFDKAFKYAGTCIL